MWDHTDERRVFQGDEQRSCFREDINIQIFWKGHKVQSMSACILAPGFTFKGLSGGGEHNQGCKGIQTVRNQYTISVWPHTNLLST